MPYSRIYLKSRFKMIWSWKIHVAILIFFPFVWQRCNLSNFDQLISTSSPNGIILNSSQINPPLSITETTYIGFCDAFPDSSLPIGFFQLTALGLSLISACLLVSFGWLLWGFRWFQLAYWLLSVDCFDVFANSSLPIVLLWLTALGTFSISACLSVFFGWLL